MPPPAFGHSWLGHPLTMCRSYCLSYHTVLAGITHTQAQHSPSIIWPKCLFQDTSKDSNIEAKKVIVFLPSLLQLFSVCRVANCGSSVDDHNISIKPNGAMIRVHCLCNSSHSSEWDSSPMLGCGKSAVPVINILISIYCLTTGLHIHQVESILAEFLHSLCSTV